MNLFLFGIINRYLKLGFAKIILILAIQTNYIILKLKHLL